MAVKSLSRSGLQASDATNSMLAGYSGSDFELIQTILVTSNVASLTFSNIDVTALGYKHLQIRYSALSTQANWCSIRLNADSGNNYANHWLHGNGGNVTSSNGGTSQPQMGMMFIAGQTFPAAGIIDFVDAFSAKNKTVRSLHGYSATGPEIALSSGLWISSNPITSIQLIHGSTVFSSGSRFSLYGVK